jgi:uncharacterized membrane protein YgcG
MSQRAWSRVFFKQQRQPQPGAAAEIINMLHWAAVAAIAHSQAAENTPKLFVLSAPSHELRSCKSLKPSQTGGGKGGGEGYSTGESGEGGEGDGGGDGGGASSGGGANGGTE